jgi:Peptidase family M28
MKRLQAMLTYCRAHGSEGERQFVERFLNPYNPSPIENHKKEVLAWCVQIGDVKDAPVLWCAHVDTVHNDKAPVKQEIVYDEACGMIYKDDKQMPLGADDGAGVWLLLEMIDAKVKGTYLFHRGEERGGIGSSQIAMYHAAFLKQFKWAIAFDRRGTGDIITEQFTGETASVAFAQEFAERLNACSTGVLEFKPSPNGIFTDTANYAEIIPECTNVSVGYDNEHSPAETLDTWHLLALRDAVIESFGKKKNYVMPVVRDPATAWKWSARITDYEAHQFGGVDGEPVCAEDVLNMKFRDLVKYVRNAPPEEVANLLMGIAEEKMDADWQHEKYAEPLWERY